MAGSLLICLNGDWRNNGDHSQGCHLLIAEARRQNDGSLKLERKTNVEIPTYKPSQNGTDMGLSTTGPAIAWTEDSENGRPIVSITRRYGDVWFFRLNSRTLQIATGENLSLSTIESTRSTSLIYQPEKKLVSVAFSSEKMLTIAQNVPDEKHANWKGWQGMFIRTGGSTSDYVHSNHETFIMDVPSGPGYVWVMYQDPGQGGYSLNFAVLDHESFAQGQDIEVMYWTLFHVDLAYQTTDSISAVFDELTQVVHVVYRGMGGGIFHFEMALERDGLPKLDQTNQGLVFHPPTQQEIPRPDSAGVWRAPRIVMYDGHLYALWQRAGDNKIVYAWADRQSNQTSWVWHKGGELDLTVHDEAMFWGFGVCVKPVT